VVGNCDLRITNSPIEVQALVTADLEAKVSNSRLQLIRMEHPVELTKVLQGLASRGFPDQIGQKRQTSYRLPHWALSPEGDSSSVGFPASSLAPPASSLAPPASSLAPPASSLAPSASSLAPSASSLAPRASSLDTGNPETDPWLLEIARPAREKPRLAPELSKAIIRRLCSGRYLTTDQIATLMDRRKDKLQKNLLAPMVDAGELTLRYPKQTTHPEQAYRTQESE